MIIEHVHETPSAADDARRKPTTLVREKIKNKRIMLGVVVVPVVQKSRNASFPGLPRADARLAVITRLPFHPWDAHCSLHG